jgi:hypothetical protein
LSFDLTDRTIYDAVYPIITNELMLAVNQAWAGAPGDIASSSTTTFEMPTAVGADARIAGNETFPIWQIWRKPVNLHARQQWAVLLINLSEQRLDIELNFSDVDIVFGDVSQVRIVDAAEPSKPQLVDGPRMVFKGLEKHESKFILINPSPKLSGISI